MYTRLTLALANAEFTNQLEGYEGVTAQCHNCESHIRGPIGLWRCVVGVGGKREIEANSFWGGGIGGNWSAHCITRWPWFTLCFVVCVFLSYIRKEGGYSEESGGDEWRADWE